MTRRKLWRKPYIPDAAHYHSPMFKGDTIRSLPRLKAWLAKQIDKIKKEKQEEDQNGPDN